LKTRPLGWIQGYNATAAVDGDHVVIVAIGVRNQHSDPVHLLPSAGAYSGQCQPAA
jgi:hypothetical protein